MSDLVSVADAAVPFDYGNLPAEVVAVLGYVGQSGAADHIWSTQDAAAARKAVGAWAPIWVPPQDLFGRDEGARAAAGMIAVLPQYDVGSDCPVFLDVERGTYDAHPADVAAGIDRWYTGMTDAGYTNAHPYAPKDYGKGWIADWVTAQPTSLPADWVGQQWAGGAHGGEYDLSVFRRDIFAPILNGNGGGDMALDKDDKAWIVKQLETFQGSVVTHVDKLHNGGSGAGAWPRNVVSVYDAVAELRKEVAGLSSGGVDTEALAHALATALGPDMAAEVVAALGKRLSG